LDPGWTGSAPPGALGLQLSGICGVEFVLSSGVREEREEEGEGSG